MLSVQDALRDVLEHAAPLPPRRVPMAESLGCVLAEEVTADRDLPPFDKALLDGYAVRSADFGGESRVILEMIEEITAGRTPMKAVGPGQCTGIMTGAPMPEGADAVVMVEESRRDGDRVVLSPGKPMRPGAGRLERGREMKAGEMLLRPGEVIGPVTLGLLASVGHVEPLVIPRPTVAIVPTGDELVPPEAEPGPGQIRNSNASSLDGLARADGASTVVAPIAPDDPDALSAAFIDALRADVVLITGGVSAGKLDLVPGILEGLGVHSIFHKVRLKPGKPLLFGVGKARGDGRPAPLVFGLPGNPASGVVGFLLFVAPALRVLRGLPSGPAATIDARLARPYHHRGDRPTYAPALLRDLDDGPTIEALPWAGSADLRTVARADGFACFPPGDREHPAGASIPFLPLPRHA